MTPNFDESWATIRPEMLALVSNGRLAAANSSARYLPQVLAETGQVAPSMGSIIPAAFVQETPDGRDMGSLLDTAVIRSKVAIGSGASSAEALQSGSKWLTGTLLTVLADTARQVVAADIAQRPNIGGYVRMLNTPSCSRCVVLAGKWFKWNEGFQRHPKCDCRHIPATNEAFANAQGFYTDPYAYFRSLSVKEQERLFGKHEAEAIREHGADIYRVMNTKLRGLGTAKGNLKYGTPTKLTVDDILSRDPSRKFVIENLQYHGYITGPQVVGGNILGRFNIGFGQLGKGGVARAASDASTKALLTGVRDPLNRYTMTAAERRLYDAHYFYNYASKTGRLAPSVGANSADNFIQEKVATAEDLQRLKTSLDNQISIISKQQQEGRLPDSVRTLAQLLSLI